MPDKPSALNEQEQKFCQDIDDFCTANSISFRQLSQLCDGHETGFSKTSAFRLRKGQIESPTLAAVRPVVLTGLVRFLENRGFHAVDIEAELSSIFDTKEFPNMLFNRCELHLPAMRHFGLSFDPFDVDRIPAEDELFTTPEIDACVSRVKDAIIYQRFVAVIGEVGSGKTLLKMRVAAELAREQTHKTCLLYPEFFDMSQVEVHSIASYILHDLGQTVPQSKPERVKKIKQILDDMHDDGVATALILDECHRLNDKLISSLKNFWELSKGIPKLGGPGRSVTNRLLGVVLFGQPQFVNSRLREVVFKEIRQRVQIIHMPDFTKAGRAYIEHRIRLAGGDPDRLFDSAALDTISRNAGTPLSLGNLTNEALLDAFDKDEPKVTPSLPFFKKLHDSPQVASIRRAS